MGFFRFPYSVEDVLGALLPKEVIARMSERDSAIEDYLSNDDATAMNLDDLADVLATGGATGYVLTQQADGSFALEAPAGGGSPSQISWMDYTNCGARNCTVLNTWYQWGTPGVQEAVISGVTVPVNIYAQVTGLAANSTSSTNTGGAGYVEISIDGGATWTNNNLQESISVATAFSSWPTTLWDHQINVTPTGNIMARPWVRQTTGTANRLGMQNGNLILRAEAVSR